MKILVTGANGQVGWELARRGEGHGFEVLALDRTALDITNAFQVANVVCRPDLSLVVNAAAYTGVDRAEEEPALAFAANSEGPANLASACAGAGIPLIHLSTDYVFDGRKQGLYKETDPVCPLGVYGRSKAEGEREVRARLQEHIILRTSWVYGVHGQNFVKTMLRLGQEKRVVRVVADQYGCPTWAADLAEAILALGVQIATGDSVAWGTYHYCGEGVTSWYGLATAIFDLAKNYIPLAVEKVEPISTAEYPTRAGRPANSALDCSLLKRTFGVQPRPWQESLAAAIGQILADSEGKGY